MSIDRNLLLTLLAQAEQDPNITSLDPAHRPRGLADRASVESLAQTYLEEQQKHWPELVGSVIVPNPSPEHFAVMADRFERAYVSGEVPEFSGATLPKDVRVGGAYTRYSDANSNPRSLNQQLINALRGAARDRVFVPWEYVFGDAATTGTNEHRRGYQLLKQLIARARAPIHTVYIDELGRASRDQIASLSLGRLIDDSGKRLVGVTDGFDSANPMSKMLLTVYAMMHELFVDQLIEKVGRGMNDAFAQGKPLYQPGFGYCLEPVLGADGQPVQSADGKVERRVVINEEEAAQVRRIFSLYSVDKVPPQEIARVLNDEQVGNRAWTSSQIRNMLRRSMYQGREPWGKTRKQTDAQTGKERTVKVPEEKWQWRDVPHLRIVDEATWTATQARLSELSRAYNVKDKSTSRSEANPRRLFHLICGHCGGQMWCDRGGERPIVRCTRGKEGVGGCTGKASKTLAQIEESLLNYILGEFASDDFIDDLLASANAFLAEFAARPAVDVEPLRKRLAKKEAARDRIVAKLESLDDDGLFERVFATLATMETEIGQLKEEINQARVDQSALSPIRHEDLAGTIGSLRDLLYDDAALAGSILASLTGPVKLIQGEPLPGKRRPQWTAEFTLLHATVFAEIARQRNCPSTDTWEFLSRRSWTFAEAATVKVRAFTNAERLAKTVAEMIGAGSNRNTVAIALGVDMATVDDAVRAWEAGKRCNLPPRDFNFRRDLPASKVDKIAADVVRMIDEEKLTVKATAEQLGVSAALVSKSYKQANGERIRALAKEGKSIKIPPALKLPRATHARIRELLTKGGMSYRAIAREVGCDHHAVSDAHKRMKMEDAA